MEEGQEAKIHLLKVIAVTCYDPKVNSFCHHHDDDVAAAFEFLEKEGMVVVVDYQREPYWYEIEEEWRPQIEWLFGRKEGR